MKKTDNKEITRAQLKALHAEFGRMGLEEDERHVFVERFTDGRTQSTRELTFDEAAQLIGRLREGQAERTQAEARRLVKQIYGLSFRISFLNRAYAGRNTEADRKMNVAKINAFCRTRTKFRKELTRMNLGELQEVKRQLEKIARDEERKQDGGTE